MAYRCAVCPKTDKLSTCTGCRGTPEMRDSIVTLTRRFLSQPCTIAALSTKNLTGRDTKPTARTFRPPTSRFASVQSENTISYCSLVQGFVKEVVREAPAGALQAKKGNHVIIHYTGSIFSILPAESNVLVALTLTQELWPMAPSSTLPETARPRLRRTSVLGKLSVVGMRVLSP